MCGIVGMAGKLSKNDESALQTLLILDSLRGIDSTGMSVISCDGDIRTVKAVGNPFELMESKAYDRALIGIHRAIIGHNRFATQGKRTKENAHPFEFSSLVGVHNGTLTSKYRLKDSQRFDVDSENLYHHINEEGLYHALEHLTGAWSLVWWDKTEDSLNFLRNEERPMFITKSVTGDCLYWASEQWMLQIALSRHKIAHEEIVSTPVNTHMSFKINKGGIIEKPHAVEMKSRAVPFITSTPPRMVTTVGGTQNKITAATSSFGGGFTKGKAAPQLPIKKATILSLNDSYKGSRNVRLEILGRAKDANGSTFYRCHDANHPSKLIRLYAKDRDRIYDEGLEIFCDISRLEKDSFTKINYYKVSYSSVRLANPAFTRVSSYSDHNGKLITKEEFMDKHGMCAYCSGHVNPDRKFRFTQEGETLCEHCAEDETITQYVNLK